MFKTLANAMKVKEIRMRILFTFLMLLVVRFGSLLPIPGVDTSYFNTLMSGDGFDFFNAVTGGSFLTMSVFALSITPYITSSIIMQLLTIAIPRLEEMQKEGEDGRKKIAEYTRYVTVALALIESIAMAVGFGGRGLFSGYSSMSGFEMFLEGLVMVVTLTAGSAFLMWLGERITDKGVGNGISIILVISIVSRIPEDFVTLYQQFIQGKSVLKAVIAIVIIAAVIIGMVAFIVYLNAGTKNIPVQYSQKISGNARSGGQKTAIPLKVNTAGVIPVIFAQSLMSFPVVIASFFNVDYSSFGGKILRGLSQGNWCDPNAPIYSIGLIVYIALIVFFAYFYTSITFNPYEVARNLQKSGATIGGITPGKPTAEYLTRILNYIIFIGAVGLTIISVIPIFFSGVFNADVSFGGKSIIIIVGVVLETIRQIEALMVVRKPSRIF